MNLWIAIHILIELKTTRYQNSITVISVICNILSGQSETFFQNFIQCTEHKRQKLVVILDQKTETFFSDKRKITGQEQKERHFQMRLKFKKKERKKKSKVKVVYKLLCYEMN